MMTFSSTCDYGGGARSSGDGGSSIHGGGPGATGAPGEVAAESNYATLSKINERLLSGRTTADIEEDPNYSLIRRPDGQADEPNYSSIRCETKSAALLDFCVCVTGLKLDPSQDIMHSRMNRKKILLCSRESDAGYESLQTTNKMNLGIDNRKFKLISLNTVFILKE